MYDVWQIFLTMMTMQAEDVLEERSVLSHSFIE